MSAVWATELEGSPITVNVLVPGGPTDTPMISDQSGWLREKMLRPEIMGPPIAWLVSDAFSRLQRTAHHRSALGRLAAFCRGGKALEPGDRMAGAGGRRGLADRAGELRVRSSPLPGHPPQSLSGQSGHAHGPMRAIDVSTPLRPP